MPEFGAHWRRKMRTLATRLDVNHDGVVTEQDFSDMANIYAELARLNRSADIYRFREGFRKVWKVFFEPIAMQATGCADRRLGVTVEEFPDGLAKSGKTTIHERVTEVFPLWFQFLDMNHDGFIQQEEFYLFHIMVGINNPQWAMEAFSVIDTNHDGRISRAEYMQAVQEFFDSEDDLPTKIFFGSLVD